MSVATPIILEFPNQDKQFWKGGVKRHEIYVRLRDEAGETDYAVAKATGLSPVVFSNWKSGKSNPKLDKLKKIADHFGVSVEVFT